ncbi:MAG: hypothetical protein DWQ44_01750 [Bacteroidetes bacterium]|nr:MAG: hypothetical protein DWQ33_05480 [Bacteroidota bacterium]REK04704.1 MAG: hypothetical protein DWQ39_05645 [Bacteroidota bacterium]REK36178.1 MAG: hypothetical protein DWQ44_01750 [Bacteroidota bacterium]REK51451.1 MAG: hypothetical protein DWQ48_01085 [Bacteroidota bacterium]
MKNTGSPLILILLVISLFLNFYNFFKSDYSSSSGITSIPPCANPVKNLDEMKANLARFDTVYGNSITEAFICKNDLLDLMDQEKFTGVFVKHGQTVDCKFKIYAWAASDDNNDPPVYMDLSYKSCTCSPCCVHDIANECPPINSELSESFPE